jgi:hypothetical protein
MICTISNKQEKKKTGNPSFFLKISEILNKTKSQNQHTTTESTMPGKELQRTVLESCHC